MPQSIHHLCRTLSSLSKSLLHWGAWNQTHYSRWGFTSAEGKGHPLDLLATLLLTPSRISLAFFVARAHCWLMLHFPHTRTPQVLFLPSCFPAGWPPAGTGAWHCSSPTRKTLFFLLLSFKNILSGNFSNLSRSQTCQISDIWIQAARDFHGSYEELLDLSMWWPTSPQNSLA